MAIFKVNINPTDEISEDVVGENVKKGDLLYLESDSKYYKATASTKDKSTTELKIALQDALIDQPIDLLYYGHYYNKDLNLVPNTKYYVSLNNGKITDQVYKNTPYVIRYIGTAFNKNTLLFNPDQTYLSDNGRKVNNVEIRSLLEAHTHTESEISDLDKYTKQEVDDLINDGLLEVEVEEPIINTDGIIGLDYNEDFDVDNGKLKIKDIGYSPFQTYLNNKI